jgi:hypothetical protein
VNRGVKGIYFDHERKTGKRALGKWLDFFLYLLL